MIGQDYATLDHGSPADQEKLGEQFAAAIVAAVGTKGVGVVATAARDAFTGAGTLGLAGASADAVAAIAAESSAVAEAVGSGLSRLNASRLDHNAVVDSIGQQLKAEGYQTTGEISFRSSDGSVLSRIDLGAIRPDGSRVLFEVKTGDAINTSNQLAVYPKIIDGNAVPVGAKAAQYGLKPGIPLKSQGFPNGITIFQVRK